MLFEHDSCIVGILRTCIHLVDSWSTLIGFVGLISFHFVLSSLVLSSVVCFILALFVWFRWSVWLVCLLMVSLFTCLLLVCWLLIACAFKFVSALVRLLLPESAPVVLLVCLSICFALVFSSVSGFVFVNCNRTCGWIVVFNGWNWWMVR